VREDPIVKRITKITVAIFLFSIPLASRVPAITYTWRQWYLLVGLLGMSGVHSKELLADNDRALVCVGTCNKVANVLAGDLSYLSKDERAWLKAHVPKWRALAKAGGCWLFKTEGDGPTVSQVERD
jgi:hypothetical protein